jgi:2,3,4,5-tetrahydropyridine-2,6-dicarboxylate N-succinyltransferase
MSHADLKATIEKAWDERDGVTPATTGEVRDAVNEALNLMDTGKARVAERGADGDWQVNQWLKQAVLLSFRLNDMTTIDGGPGKATWWDKVPSKFDGWGEAEFKAAGFRAVPNCVVRRSAYIAPGVVLMPSFVNLGAYVDSGTMVDTWATVGSCAQIGKNVHLSGGVGIGGVLEPMQAGPTSSSRTTASSARAPKWSRDASCAKARCLAWASISASPPRSSTGPPARSCTAKCRPTRSSCPAPCPASRCPTASPARRCIVP